MLVRCENFVFNYGEIIPSQYVNVGDMVEEGDVLGWVVPVLKKNKGRPMTMLHLEMYEKNILIPTSLNAGILSFKICISIIPISTATTKAIIYIKTLQNVFAIFLYCLSNDGRMASQCRRLFAWNAGHTSTNVDYVTGILGGGAAAKHLLDSLSTDGAARNLDWSDCRTKCGVCAASWAFVSHESAIKTTSLNYCAAIK